MTRYFLPGVEQVAQQIVRHELGRIERKAEIQVDPPGPVPAAPVERGVARPVVHHLIQVIMRVRGVERRIPITERVVLVFEIGIRVLDEQVETRTHRHVESEISAEVIRIQVFCSDGAAEHVRHIVVVVHERSVQKDIHPLGGLELGVQVCLDGGMLLILPRGLLARRAGGYLQAFVAVRGDSVAAERGIGSAVGSRAHPVVFHRTAGNDVHHSVDGVFAVHLGVGARAYLDMVYHIQGNGNIVQGIDVAQSVVDSLSVQKYGYARSRSAVHVHLGQGTHRPYGLHRGIERLGQNARKRSDGIGFDLLPRNDLRPPYLRIFGRKALVFEQFDAGQRGGKLSGRIGRRSILRKSRERSPHTDTEGE